MIDYRLLDINLNPTREFSREFCFAAIFTFSGSPYQFKLGDKYINYKPIIKTSQNAAFRFYSFLKQTWHWQHVFKSLSWKEFYTNGITLDIDKFNAWQCFTTLQAVRYLEEFPTIIELWHNSIHFISDHHPLLLFILWNACVRYEAHSILEINKFPNNWDYIVKIPEMPFMEPCIPQSCREHSALHRISVPNKLANSNNPFIYQYDNYIRAIASNRKLVRLAELPVVPEHYSQAFRKTVEWIKIRVGNHPLYFDRAEEHRRTSLVNDYCAYMQSQPYSEA